MKYFLYGYYGFGNVGDDWLLRCLLRGISERDSDAHFRVRCLNPGSGWPDPRVEFVPLDQIWKGPGFKVFKLSRFVKACLKEVWRAEVVVLGGGTLFMDKGRRSVSMFMMAAMALAARVRGRRLVVVGAGVDVLSHPTSVWFLRRIIDAAEVIALRDAFSMTYVPPRARRKALLTADLSFLEPLEECPPVERVNRVGFCFVDYFRTDVLDPGRHQRYEQALERMLSSVPLGKQWVGLVLQAQEGLRDDWAQAHLQSRYPKIKYVTLSRVEDLLRLRDHVDAVVTTRYHLALAALRQGLPVCVIDHESKLATLAQDFDLPSVPMEEFISNGVLPWGCLERLKEPEKVKERLNQMAFRARDNFLWMGKNGAP